MTYCEHCGTKMEEHGSKIDMWMNYDILYKCPKCGHTKWWYHL